MSINEPHPDPEMTEFENALAGLRPQSSPINRDRLLFEAGRAESWRQGRTARRILGTAAGAAVLAASAVGWFLVDARRQLGELELALRAHPAPSSAARERPAPAASSTPAVVAPEPAPSAWPGSVVAVSGSPAGLLRDLPVDVRNPLASWPSNPLGWRQSAWREGDDVLGGVSRGTARRGAPSPGGGPRTNGELRQRYLQRATQQPAEFEKLLEGLPLQEGERS